MDTPDVLAWRDGYIEALDQTALPHQVRVQRITTVDQLVDAITTLTVRGAPVLGALLPPGGPRVDEVQVADDDHDPLETEGVEHVTYRGGRARS